MLHHMAGPRLRVLVLLVMMLLALPSCSASPEPQPSPTPPKASVNYQAVEAAIEDQIKAGSLGLSTINAVMVSVDGKTVVAHYRNGARPDQALHVWSVTKSVTSALIGIAIGEGLIDSLDATLAQLLPEYRTHLNAQQAKITLRQLMTMTAGYPSDQPTTELEAMFAHRSDPVPMVLRKGPATEPGAIFEYSSIGSHLVSAVLRSALRRADGDHPRTILQYARQKLFDPLEIDSRPAYEKPTSGTDIEDFDALTEFGWGTDAGGLHSGCCLLRLRPADMVKLGELYLGNGVWHGKQILPVGWVQQTMTPSSLSSRYGLMWWLETDQGGKAIWAAEGSDGQLIAVVPDRQVVVAIGSVPTKDYATSHSDVLYLAINTILPAIE